jgi:hypothetical protein
LGFGTRDTVTSYPLTPVLRTQLIREVRRYAAWCLPGTFALALGGLLQVLPVPVALHVLGWLAILPTTLILLQEGVTAYQTIGDLRSGVYTRRSGAIGTDLTATRSENSGSLHYWLTMMGRRYAVPRDTYEALRAIPYAVIEHTPSGLLLRVRDFDGVLAYTRWPGCAFPPQDDERERPIGDVG